MNKKPIDNRRWIDKDWGGIASCEALPFSSEWPYGKGTCVPDRNPWEAMCDFIVTYENGKKARLFARGREILSGEGFRGIVEGGKDDETIRFFPLGLVGVTAQALADGSIIPSGKVDLLGDEAATSILEANGIPTYPIDEDEELEGKTYRKWVKDWIDKGICVDDTGGHGMCVSKMLLNEEAERIRRGDK